MLGDREKQGRRVKWVESRVGSEADDKDDGGESGVGTNVNLLGYKYTYFYIFNICLGI